MTSRCRHSFPRVAPTGRAVLLPVVVVMGFEADSEPPKVAYERIYRDQASRLVQVGLLDQTLLPVTGVVQAHKVLDEDLAVKTLLSAGKPGASSLDPGRCGPTWPDRGRGPRSGFDRAACWAPQHHPGLSWPVKGGVPAVLSKAPVAAQQNWPRLSPTALA